MQPQSCQKITLVLFSIHYNNSFGLVFYFLKETGCLPLLPGTSSDRTDSLIRVRTAMAVNTHRTLFPTSFLMEWYTVNFSIFQPRNWGHRVSCLKYEIFHILAPNLWCSVYCLKYEIFYISAQKLGV